MKTYTITAEIEVKFQPAGMGLPPGEFEVEYPTVEIEYRYSPDCPARIRYDENDHPAEPAEVELIRAKLIDGCGCGLNPTQDQLYEWAERWLDDEGYEKACENARQLNEPDEPPERERDYP